jgi:outer membrane protein TolC
MWNGAASVTQPVFAAGAIRSGMRLAEAQKQELLLTYQQTIMNAFQEVSNSLVAYQKDREFREHGTRNSVVDDARVEIDILIQLTQPEVVIFERDLLGLERRLRSNRTCRLLPR